MNASLFVIFSLKKMMVCLIYMLSPCYFPIQSVNIHRWAKTWWLPAYHDYHSLLVNSILFSCVCKHTCK